MRKLTISLILLFLFSSFAFAFEHSYSEVKRYSPSEEPKKKLRELKKSGTTRTEVLDSLGQPDEVREENFGQDIWHYDDVIVDGFGLGTSFGPRTVELRFRNDKVIPYPYLKWLFLKGLDIIFFPIFAFLRIMPFKHFIVVPMLFFSLVGFLGMKEFK